MQRGSGSQERSDPDGWVPPKAWCYRRVQPFIEKREFGNAYGNLRADLMRSKETAPLVDKLDRIRDFDSFCAFVDKHLKEA